jgi:hypothetical protein
MSHPLAGEKGRALGKRWAATKAELKNRDELHLVEGGFLILKADAFVTELPTKFVVFDQDGAPVLPSPGKRFFITTESINPFHAITELE